MDIRLKLMVVAAALAAAPAGAGECPPPGVAGGAPAVTLTVTAADPTYLNSRSRQEITVLAGHAAELHVRNTGLTRSRAEFRVRPNYRLMSYPDGQTCVMLHSVNATWAIVELTVDIAREYSPGTCQYREVKTHEDEHVRINHYTLRQFAPQLEARLRREAAAVRPVLSRRPGKEVASEITRRLSAAGQEVVAEFHTTLKQRHGAIDTAENYRAVSRRCTGW